MRRPPADEPLPPADRWLLSWTDFLILLLAVFAALYASASVDLARANAVSQSVGRALGGNLAPAPAVDAAPAADAAPASDAAVVARQLADALAALGLGERVQVRQEARGVGIDIDATLLFATGDARLTPQSAAAVGALAGVLRPGPWQVAVEGHTDSVAIRTVQFASNWELSAMRAAVVARRLSELGIDPRRLAATGHADSRPLGDNQTADGRARNRRVHLLVMMPG